MKHAKTAKGITEVHSFATVRRPADANPAHTLYCRTPPVAERQFAREVNPQRARLIRMLDKKWVNGTVLHYHFFRSPPEWTTSERERDVVRRAFQIWKDLGIGLEFREVDSPAEAEIRIGFQRGDGAWSYVGRDIVDLGLGPDARTMNFGWDLTSDPREIDTALHEIGHALGFPHEHQNPNAGIVWNEEAVYAALARPPNNWPREVTYHNIIRKIPADAVQGSAWDPNSVMHYPFGPGLIDQPVEFRDGLVPAGGLSERDREWVRTFYPPLGPEPEPTLEVATSVKLAIAPGEQRNFQVLPNATRYYHFSTFGDSDTVMVLFEDVNGELRYLTADDDSGVDRNASFRVKLFAGRRYVLRVRLYYAQQAGATAVMMW